MNAPNTPSLRTTVVALAALALIVGGILVWSLNYSSAARNGRWTEGWQSVSSFHTARRALAAATNGQYLYVIGGVDANGHYAKTVEYAGIRPDGSLGPWRPTSALGTGRIYLAAAYLNGYLYALGGGSGPLGSDNTPTALVERARVNADGSLGPWRKDAYMSSPRRGLKVVVYHNHLFAIGGYNGMFLRSTERADVGPDGHITAWTEEKQKSVLVRYIHSAARWRDRIYLLGGHVQSPVKMDYGDVESTALTPGDHLTPWTIEKTALETPRFVASAFAMGGYLYILGGHNETHRLRSVEYARIGAGGHVGPWRYNAPLPLERSATAVAVAGGTAYVLGGMGDGRILNNVVMARQGPRGQLGRRAGAYPEKPQQNN